MGEQGHGKLHLHNSSSSTSQSSWASQRSIETLDSLAAGIRTSTTARFYEGPARPPCLSPFIHPAPPNQPAPACEETSFGKPPKTSEPDLSVTETTKTISTLPPFHLFSQHESSACFPASPTFPPPTSIFTFPISTTRIYLYHKTKWRTRYVFSLMIL